jgi:hypothetical protein
MVEHVAVVRPGPHIDLVAGDRVLGGIGHQVEEELPEALAVAAHRGQRVAYVGCDLHLVVA